MRSLLMPLLCYGLLAVAPAAAQPASATGVEGETLEDFFTAALEFSPRLRIAEENLNITVARTDAATGRLLPQLIANANINDNRRDDEIITQRFIGERYSMRLTQVLFNWQAFAARRRALASEDQAEAEYFYELATILTDVADRYLNVLQAQDTLTSIESELEAVSSQLELIQSRYDLQLAQITDLYQAQASLAQVQAEQLRLQSELALAEEALRSATGLDVGELYTLQDAVELEPVTGSVQSWVQTALENNYQIKAREYAVEAAQEGIAERQGAYLPQVSFIAQVLESNVGFDNLPLNQAENTFIGVDVSIPLYSGGSNRAAVREARSLEQIAENELRQIELEASERVRAAYLQAQSSASIVAAAEALVESTTLSSEAMRQGFELGTVTSVDVLNALRDQFRAERDLQQARYEHIRFLLLLKREAGTLSATDMMEVGSWMQAPTP